MFDTKKAARLRTAMQKHNNQDTRVTVESQCSTCKTGKSEKWKELRRLLVAFWIRQALSYAWENRAEFCDLAYEAIGSVLGLLMP